MTTVLIFALGFVTGLLIRELVRPFTKAGTLRIDRSDPDDQPYMFLELDKKLKYRKGTYYIDLKVANENYISRK